MSRNKTSGNDNRYIEADEGSSDGLDRDDDSGRGYKVGYGKPPKHTQFRKGQSGNPAGRRKDAKSSDTMLREVLSAPITLTENGQTRTVSKEEAMYMALMSGAIKGDARARAQLFAMMERLKIEESKSDRITHIEFLIIDPKPKSDGDEIEAAA